MNKKYIYSLLASMLLISQTSFSQTNADTVELDEIILSLPFNQDRGKSVIKVNKINLNSINPILKSYISKSISKLPGISLISTGPGIAKPSIRGLSASRVIIYNQGVRLENHQWGDEHGVGVSTSGISSVELIKGPAYVLYGSDAMGGVLYIEPERYSNDFSVDYMGIYNSNYSGITNNLGLKGSSGDFSYVLRGNMTDNQNFSSPDGEVENTWFKEYDFQGGLKYQSEKFSSDLRLSMNISELGIPQMEEGHEEGHDDHGGLTLANYLQQDAELDGYEIEFGNTFDLASGELMLSFGRDEVTGEFSNGGNIPRLNPARNIYRVKYSQDEMTLGLVFKDVEKQNDIGLGETATDAHQMLNAKFTKSFNLGNQGALTLSLFGNNLLDEVARNHSSYVKKEVPLPGRNYGVRFNLTF